MNYKKDLEEAKKMFDKHQQLYELIKELYPLPNYYGLEHAQLIFENNRLSCQVRLLNLQRIIEENHPSSNV